VKGIGIECAGLFDLNQLRNNSVVHGADPVVFIEEAPAYYSLCPGALDLNSIKLLIIPLFLLKSPDRGHWVVMSCSCVAI